MEKILGERDLQPRLSCARCGFMPPDGSTPQIAGKWTTHDPTDICLPCWHAERLAALPTMNRPPEVNAREHAQRVAALEEKATWNELQDVLRGSSSNASAHTDGPGPGFTTRTPSPSSKVTPVSKVAARDIPADESLSPGGDGS